MRPLIEFLIDPQNLVLILSIIALFLAIMMGLTLGGDLIYTVLDWFISLWNKKD